MGRRSHRRRRLRSALLPALGALALACSAPESALEIREPELRGDGAWVAVRLGSSLDPATLRLRIDGDAVEPELRPGAGEPAAWIALEPGRHRVQARAQTRRSSGGTGRRRIVEARREVRVPAPAPALLASVPRDGASEVPGSAWIRLRFARNPDLASLEGMTLSCDGAPVALDAELLGEGRVLVNPSPALASGARCSLAWRGPEGAAALRFRTAPAGPPLRVPYDRTRSERLDPFPDDFFLEPDPGTPTGRRVALPLPDRSPRLRALFAALTRELDRLDGWSPIAPLVLATSGPVDPDSVPSTPAASTEPLASVFLLDLTPGAATYGERVPFRLQVRSDTTGAGIRGDTLLVYPSLPLRSRARYALVVTRRARAAPGRPLAPSPFLRRVLGPPSSGEPAAVARTRDLLAPVLGFLEDEARPRVPREDLALVLRLSVRSTESIPEDLLAMREQILAAPPPALLDYRVTPGEGEVAAVVRGHWEAPDWRERRGGRPAANVSRGPDGLPRVQGTRPVEFVLALPASAREEPAPLIVHQHGNPGSPDEVVDAAGRFLAGGGFAVAGFGDVLNREIAPPGPSEGERIELQALDVLNALLSSGSVPDHWLETTAEQLAFLRFLPELAALDVLPLGAPDGVPDLDPGAPISYHGVSEGGNQGQALLAYAPELAAAALVAGGARTAEVLVHQQAGALVDLAPRLFPGLAPADLWTGVALFQTLLDRQDPHNHLEFVFRNPVEVDGTRRKPSVLVIEGLDDSLVPNHATDSTAGTLGLPHLAPVQRAVPFLDVVEGPVQGNLPAGRSGAYFQYVPLGIPGVEPTPSCAAWLQAEGHHCAQIARESQLQRLRFFRSALQGGPPVIESPLSRGDRRPDGPARSIADVHRGEEPPGLETASPGGAASDTNPWRSRE